MILPVQISGPLVPAAGTAYCNLPDSRNRGGRLLEPGDDHSEAFKVPSAIVSPSAYTNSSRSTFVLLELLSDTPPEKDSGVQTKTWFVPLTTCNALAVRLNTRDKPARLVMPWSRAHLRMKCRF